MIQDAKSQTANKDIDVQYAPTHDIAVRGDKGRIAEVIWNLLDNAIKFTDKGVISIKARKEGSQATATVRDTGRGINPEVLPRLFCKFVTKSDKGTGLGLYISKSIIEAHGGRIWAENNEDGNRATFTFTLPLN